MASRIASTIDMRGMLLGSSQTYEKNDAYLVIDRQPDNPHLQLDLIS